MAREKQWIFLYDTTRPPVDPSQLVFAADEVEGRFIRVRKQARISVATDYWAGTPQKTASRKFFVLLPGGEAAGNARLKYPSKWFSFPWAIGLRSARFQKLRDLLLPGAGMERLVNVP